MNAAEVPGPGELGSVHFCGSVSGLGGSSGLGGAGSAGLGSAGLPPVRALNAATAVAHDTEALCSWPQMGHLIGAAPVLLAATLVTRAASNTGMAVVEISRATAGCFAENVILSSLRDS